MKLTSFDLGKSYYEKLMYDATELLGNFIDVEFAHAKSEGCSIRLVL